ncbi:MAG TPA: nucleotidyltransferase [Opitutales bacterium]|nr:nucleotidyltransferase [Opitutales bacterium]
MSNLLALLERLGKQEVEFVLVGGFAAVVHGSTMVTRDVDVCCRFTEENLRKLHAAVADLHPVHRMRPDLPFTLAPEAVAGLKNLYLLTDLGVLDCLGEVKGVGDFGEVSKHSIAGQFPFGKCLVIDLPTLILAKEAMRREKDLQAVRQLRAIQEHRQANPPRKN